MNAAPLLLPRRLAIQLLAHAQRSDQAIAGHLVGTTPDALSFRPGEPDAPAPAQGGIWAWVRAQDTAGKPADIPPGASRLLTVALDTKGVLQLRCWEQAAGGIRERVLQIGE